MGNKDVPRRTFLSASAVTAVAATTLTSTAIANASSSPTSQVPDPDLRAMLREVDPARIKATVLRLVQFGTRHTLSSQTDPVRGIGAATNWVFDQMQSFATASSGRMTVQKQSFVQPASSRIPVPTTITNVIATLKGTATPERVYVVTGHLDSRVTDVLNFTDDAPGADKEPVMPTITVAGTTVSSSRRGGRGVGPGGASLSACSAATTRFPVPWPSRPPHPCCTLPACTSPRRRR